jgi:hypothetical protein
MGWSDFSLFQRVFFIVLSLPDVAGAGEDGRLRGPHRVDAIYGMRR